MELKGKVKGTIPYVGMFFKECEDLEQQIKSHNMHDTVL